jgi:hypothetical protein
LGLTSTARTGTHQRAHAERSCVGAEPRSSRRPEEYFDGLPVSSAHSKPYPDPFVAEPGVESPAYPARSRHRAIGGLGLHPVSFLLIEDPKFGQLLLGLLKRAPRHVAPISRSQLYGPLEEVFPQFANAANPVSVAPAFVFFRRHVKLRSHHNSVPQFRPTAYKRKFHGLSSGRSRRETACSQGKTWWAQQDSNLRPADYESVALPLRHGPASGRIIPNRGIIKVCEAVAEERCAWHRLYTR